MIEQAPVTLISISDQNNSVKTTHNRILPIDSQQGKGGSGGGKKIGISPTQALVLAAGTTAVMEAVKLK